MPHIAVRLLYLWSIDTSNYVSWSNRELS